MERQKISQAALIKILLEETSRVLGKDASFLEQQLELRRRDGEPNWDANCGIAAPPIVQAFGVALNKLQEQYNLT